MNIHPTLYKKSSTGAVLEWYQERDGGKYRTVAGQQNGKKVTSEWTICIGKNIGRSNETTPEQQAELEVAACYKKKLDQSQYHEDIKNIGTTKYQEPMLAYAIEKYPLTGMAFERGLVWGQPKLDGFRCIAEQEGPFSRKGNPFFTVPHIHDALRGYLDVHEFDGELYNHEYKRDFEEISSMLRKQPPDASAPQKKHDQWAAALEMAKTKVQYHVYDLPLCPGGFEERTERLAELVKQIGHPQIIYVETVKLRDESHMIEYFDQKMADGYEGGIARIGGQEYVRKRVKYLLKYKLFVDEEMTILDIEEGTGNWSGAAKGVWFAMPDGARFKATMMGDRDYCREIFENRQKYIGCEATVKRSKDLTKAGVPRWGNVKIIHKNGKREI